MALTAENELKHLGKSKGIADHDHDLIHELSKRLDSLWRCDQYIANAQQREEIRSFWEDVKTQEQENIQRLKELIAKEINDGCF